MNAHLRLLEVIQDNRLGGISVRALSAVGGLREEGIESIFVLPQEAGDVADTCRDRGYPTSQILLKRPHPRRLGQTMLWLCTFPWSVWQILRLIHRHAPDAVHVNGLIGLQAAVAAKLSGTPLIWHLAGTQTYPRWLVRLLRPFLRRAECIISISPRVETYFLGSRKGDGTHLPERPGGGSAKMSPVPFSGRVIFEPVDVTETDTRSKRAERSLARQALGLQADERVICTVGNLSPVKGTLVLLEAARQLCEVYDNLRFLIVGAQLKTQRDYVAEVMRKIRDYDLEERVLLLGKRTDVDEILQASDLFVLPSLSEGTPLSILEAMANRVPVIASDVGGIPDQIQNGVSGCLVPAGDAAALFTAIQRVLDNPSQVEAYVEAAYDRVTQQFSLDGFVSTFSQAVRETASSSRGGSRVTEAARQPSGRGYRHPGQTADSFPSR